jgi:hypothetical protein
MFDLKPVSLVDAVEVGRLHKRQRQYSEINQVLPAKDTNEVTAAAAAATDTEAECTCSLWAPSYSSCLFKKGRAALIDTVYASLIKSRVCHLDCSEDFIGSAIFA